MVVVMVGVQGDDDIEAVVLGLIGVSGRDGGSDTGTGDTQETPPRRPG